MRECDNCLETGRLLMPVQYDTLFHRYVSHECLRCRLNFNRHGMADNYTLRVEGRHQRPGAWPVPCSLMALERRTP